MIPHAVFISKLLELVEYAAKHELEVPYLALNATVELIAPSLARNMTVGSDAATPFPNHHVAAPATKSGRDLHLKVLDGGLSRADPI